MFVFLDCISRTSGTFNRNIKLEGGYMLEPPNLKALKTIDFCLLPFAFARLLREQRFYKQEKKQILKTIVIFLKIGQSAGKLKVLG